MENFKNITYDSLQSIITDVEKIWNRRLNVPEISIIYRLIVKEHISLNLLAYAAKTSSERNIFQIHYLEKMLLYWKENGILTVIQAKEDQRQYYELCSFFFKEVRLGCDVLPSSINKLVHKWRYMYHYNSDRILNAFRKVMEQSNQCIFLRADELLTQWYESEQSLSSFFYK